MVDQRITPAQVKEALEHYHDLVRHRAQGRKCHEVAARWGVVWWCDKPLRPNHPSVWSRTYDELQMTEQVGGVVCLPDTTYRFISSWSTGGSGRLRPTASIPAW